MAAVETTKSASYGISYGSGPARDIVCDSVVVALATTMLDNADDNIGLLWVPKGAVIVGVAFHGTDMDSGTPALVFDIGDADDADRLVAASTVGQTATSTTALATTGFLYKYTTRTRIRLYVKTAAATPVAGTAYFAIQYFVDENYDRTALVPA